MDLRFDDPDPRIRDLASVAFLDEAIGRPFLVRWAGRKQATYPLRLDSNCFRAFG